MDKTENEIIIYQTNDGETAIDVRLENDTVWLSQAQMAELFQKDQSVIARHIANVFKEGELDKNSNMQILHNTFSKYKPTVIYPLDVIISVGYRVKSQRGTQFRIWANKVLKNYLINGFAVRNKLTEQKYKELNQMVQLLGRTIENYRTLSTESNESLFGVVVDYSYALQTLDRYDYQQLSMEATTAKPKFRATYQKAKKVIEQLKLRFGESQWFGNEKDGSFKSSIGQIYQTFDGNDLYPSVEEKAAMLLYLVVKNHSFTDGNKRIAAMLFIWFMHRNDILYSTDGHKRIADNTLVALTLLIAESRPEEKDVIVKVLVNLINKNNV